MTTSSGTLEPGEYPVIDSHVHIWKRDPRFPWAKETAHPPKSDATPEMLLEVMRGSGVSRAVLVQVIHYRSDNSYVADALNRFPGVFHGVARVNTEDPASPDHLSSLITECGFSGVRITPTADRSGDWIRGPLMDPLWKRCRELNVPMAVLAPIERIPDVARLIDRFPDLDVVIDHMADSPADRPEALKHLIALKRYPGVYIKLTHAWSVSRQPYPYPDSQIQIKKLYDAFGPKRLMWGSDWPLVEAYCGYGRALELVRHEMPFLNANDKRWILSKNAQRVFFREPEG